MAPHFDRERALQGRIEAVLDAALPTYEVLDVVLDEPHEKVVVFIDGADGIGLADCEAVTHAIRDTCPDHELEVSSPGIERPMRAPAHFREALGEKVRIRRAGHHRAMVATVEAVDEVDGITLRPDGGEPVQVQFDDVVRCRLVVEDPFAAAAARKEGRE
jgi:ribosome maturation factor RimP